MRPMKKSLGLLFILWGCGSRLAPAGSKPLPRTDAAAVATAAAPKSEDVRVGVVVPAAVPATEPVVVKEPVVVTKPEVPVAGVTSDCDASDTASSDTATSPTRCTELDGRPTQQPSRPHPRQDSLVAARAVAPAAALERVENNGRDQ